MLPHVPLARLRTPPHFAAPHWGFPNTCPPHPPDGAPWGPLPPTLLPATPQLPCLGPISLHSPTELYQFPTLAVRLPVWDVRLLPQGCVLPSAPSITQYVTRTSLCPWLRLGHQGCSLVPSTRLCSTERPPSAHPRLPNILPTPVLQAWCSGPSPLPPIAPVSSKPTWSNSVAASHMWLLKPTFYLNYKVVPQPPSQFQVRRSHRQLRVTGVLANAGLGVSATTEHATGQLWNLTGWSP